MATRADMDAALKAIVVPRLRGMGFKGSLPHLHRMRDGAVDLLSFLFRSSGGSFVVELGRVADDGFDFHGRRIAPAKANATYLFPKYRHRLGSPLDTPGDHWFDFATNGANHVSGDVLRLLDQPELWQLLDSWPVLGRADPALFRY